MFDKHIPAAYIGAARLVAVPTMLNRSGHVPKFVIDMDKRASFSKFYGIAIRAADLFGDRIIREAGYPKSHVVVAGAHAAEFKKAADPVEDFTDPAPRKSGMRVVVRAAVVFPVLHTLWRNGFSRVKNAREAHVGMEVIIARPNRGRPRRSSHEHSTLEASPRWPRGQGGCGISTESDWPPR